MGGLKLPSSPLKLRDHGSNKFLYYKKKTKKNVAEVKTALQGGKPLDKFDAYLKTFQEDIRLKEGLLFNDNKLKTDCSSGPQIPFRESFTRNTPRTVLHEDIGQKHLVAPLISRNLSLRQKLRAMF